MENNIVMENIENKGKSKGVLIFQIITAILYLMLSFFLIYSFIDSVLIVENPDTHSLGVAVFFVIIVVIIGGIGAAINALVSLAGLMFAIFKRKKGFIVSKGKIAYFIVFIVLPILTVLILGIITKLMV